MPLFRVPETLKANNTVIFKSNFLTTNYNIFFFHSLQNVAPIGDDGDGHLAYKLGDVIEHENQRCKCENYKNKT